MKVSTTGEVPLDSWDSRELYTQQTCHVNPDESEVCYYSGVLCFDGEGPVVSVAEPEYAVSRPVDPSHDCIDTRFKLLSLTQASSCYPASSKLHPYKLQDAFAQPAGHSHK